MTLRRKTLAIIGATFLGLIVILYFISQNILLGSSAELEEQNTHQNVERVLSALSAELSFLEATAGDWSAWDDTYSFIEDANDKYIHSNLIDGTFIELRLNLMMFIHSSGRTVFGKAFDLYDEEEVSVPQSLQRQLSTSDLLLTHPDTESSITGIVHLPEGPMLIASQPILTSEDEGPIRGTLIMGRYLDAAEIERLAEQTQLSLVLYQFTDLQMPPDFQVARLSLSKEAPVFIQPLDEHSIAGYALLKDIYGKPSLMLRADMPRDIYRQSQNSFTYLILAIVAAGVVCGVVGMLFVERQVLSRLARLSKNVSSIGTSGDLSARVSMTGTDELSTLGGTINGMLAALQEYQDELRGSEERYRLLAENVTDFIWTADINLRFTYVSPSVTLMLGYSADEAMALSLEELLTPASLEVTKRAFIETPAIEGLEQMGLYQSPTLEVEIKCKDGSTVWIETRSTFLHSQGNRPAGFVGVAHDITERKRAERKLQELYEQERRLRQELEAEIKKRVEFTRALVHELKTPLTSVMASSELLAAEQKEEPWLSLARNIYRGASNLNNRIDELIDIARGEVGMLQLELRPVDLLQLLHSVADEMAPVASSYKQSVTLDLPSFLPLVQADEDRLRQVLLNLLGNASKFTSEGGNITLRAREKDNFVIVEVQDTGRGIAKEEQQRLFEPYSRVESDGSARLSGLGLGLSLCKALVELHGGRIWVKSQKGKGSTFSFSVPLEPASRSEEAIEAGGKP